MTIIALTEQKNTLSMSTFNREGKLVAGNFVIKMEPVTYPQLLETIGAYVGQYVSDDSHPGIAVQAGRSSLIDFITKDLNNAGLPIVAVKGESHEEMAQSVVKFVEQEKANAEAAAAAQQEAANSEPEDVQMADSNEIEEAQVVEAKPENKPKRNKPRKNRRHNKQSGKQGK